MRKASYILIFVFSFLSVLSNAQTKHADCSNPIVLKDTIYNSPVISGYGEVREFDGYELENKRFFEKESNSIWYLITMPADGLLMFDIKASGPNDDWDFILFEHKSMFCKRIADKKIAPVRTNLSRSPTTGLSRKGRTAFVGAGLNDSYSTPIRAKKGQKFVLVVNLSLIHI